MGKSCQPLPTSDARRAFTSDAQCLASLAQTRLRHFDYEGPQALQVRRSAITLKLLDYFANGGIVAAPTSSLPELIGGSRNWDYRYTWVRDAAFSVYALRRIGLVREGAAFLGWVLDAVERGGRPKVLYNMEGRQPPPERQDPELAGYRNSSPVRWGNAAAEQWQHDVYGEILDCAYQWVTGGGEIDEGLWGQLQVLIEAARGEWHRPDQGIWEVRTGGRPFTYSAALCQVALDRGARLAGRFGLAGDMQGWRAAATQIRQAILEEAWDAEVGSLTEHLGGGGLDASLLALPLRRVIPAEHPRMVATTAAIAQRLGAGHGLLYRYLPEDSPDGLPGHEGAFLLCSFWLVDNLAKQGRLDEALELYASLCARAGPLGLLPEQIEPSSGAFLGNYPQAFSHVGLISSGINLSRLIAKERV
jgi:alpha,alpha-trehalase